MRSKGTRTTEPREHGQVAAATCSLALLAAGREAPAWLLLPQASAAGAVHARLASRTSCGGSSDGERLVLALGYWRRWRRCHCHSALQPLLFAERNERREVPHDLVRVASLHV
eukprot:tig00021178_g19213.t1